MITPAQELLNKQILHGIKMIKVPGINGPQAWLMTELEGLIVDFDNKFLMYKINPTNVHIPMVREWIYVPFTQLYGIAFNDKPPNHETHNTQDHHPHQDRD